MVSKTFSLPLDVYVKLTAFASDENTNESQAASRLIKLGLAYHLLLKEQEEKK